MRTAIGTSLFVIVLLSILLTGGCERKSTPPNSDYTSNNLGDTSYIEISPPFGPFEKPSGVIVGNDQLLYVIDQEADAVYMLDASGVILARRTIPHPIAIAQNYKLDLYVAGETLDTNSNAVIGAIYRISLARFDTTYLAGQVFDSLRNEWVPFYRDTSYFFNHDLANAHCVIVWSEPARPARRFTGIGILPGNEYLVTRVGSDNSSFVDPDTRLLYFTRDYAQPYPVTTLITRASGGTAITDIRNLTGVMVIPSSSNFILTQSSEQVSYGAIWMVYSNTPDFTGWKPNYDPSIATQAGIDFVRANRFRHAAGATYDRRRREIFIVDSELDSVVKFNRVGQFKSESFGRYKSISPGETYGLLYPTGIAYSNDCTIYISDAGDADHPGVIRRYKLSTQLTCF